MVNINEGTFSRNVSAYLNRAVMSQDVINVCTENGNAVLLNAEDYGGLLETLYLLSIPSMKERLVDGLNTPVEECDEFEW